MALSGERRQLTVLFCDLVGFTNLSENLDPEDLNEVINAYEQTCRQSIEQFGGYFDNLHGDCAVGFFGYPTSGGDEAERSIDAAFAIRSGVGRLMLPGAPPLEVHAGIATGTIVIHVAHGVPKFVGEPLTLAARLQSLAVSGEVLVSGSTHALARLAFKFRNRGVQRLKGFSQGVAVWQVRPPSGDSRHHAVNRPRTPFVGRLTELRSLAEAWQRCQSGHGESVLVVGEPGIGKSRLVKEFVGNLAPDIFHVSVACDAQRSKTVLFPFVQHLHEAAGMRLLDAREKKLEKIKRLPQFSDLHTPAWLIRLLGIEEPEKSIDPEQLRRQTIEGLIEYFTELADRQPLLLHVEDAHWIDPTSAELLWGLRNRLQATSALMIVTTRTTGHLARLGGESHTLTLSRLGEAETLTIISRLAAKASLPSGVAGEIARRTEGVPLFVEELTFAVCGRVNGAKSSEMGALFEGTLPSSVKESVLIRLDQIAAAKRVAQIASVIGCEFDLEVLEDLAGERKSVLRRGLEDLARSGFVSPLGKGDRFVFHHAIVRDGAYGSLLRSDKRQLHQRLAELLAQQAPTDPGYAPEIIAHHFTEAGILDKAVDFHLEAAAKLLERASNREVLAHTSEGLQLLARLPRDGTRRYRELSLQLMRGAAFWVIEGFSSAEVESTFLRARELAEDCGKLDQRFIALRGLFGCYYGRGQLLRAARLAEDVRAVADMTGQPSDQCVANLLAGQIALWRGRLIDARTFLELALSQYHESEQRQKLLSTQIDPAVNARIHSCWVLWKMGLPDTALRLGDEALSLARRIGQPFGLSMALLLVAIMKSWRGDREQSRMLGRELRKVTADYGISYLAASAKVLEGEDLIASGHPEQGIALVISGLSHFEQQSGGLGWPWAMTLVATGLRALGRPQEGIRAIDKALLGLRRNDERHWEAELHRLKGELLFETGAESRSAMKEIRRALMIARHQHATALELRASISVAKYSHREADRQRALFAVRSTRARFTEGEGTADISTADALLDGTLAL
ncbi:ATP-binding protein [Allomesorhizobium alhagi]|uniref:Adenylate/guanylate cyclase n=1 Tax=Mesorhizobium alhagi CCNWXJ12-2 TaxID=1107882 RepID=H0HUP1_9HYPH|nr:AAA family ATPase [Mesorhizobium alhagi]EHK55587.1 adenylate/guanylate cyclase [Mesorhizobium alhagi CCNWXJ12-2]